jgi:hypothetical protein
MEEFRNVLTQQIGEIVSNVVGTVTEEEEDDQLETSDEIKPKAWLELVLILKEHLTVDNKHEAQKKKKKNTIVLLQN